MSSGDLEALLRVTAPGYQGESPPDVAIGTAETSVGRLLIAVTGRGVAACSYEDEPTLTVRLTRAISSFIGPDARRVDPVRRELEAYFAGRLRAFSLPIDHSLVSQFGRVVLQALSAVPYGMTTTYAEIATSIGRPQATRAVGNALASNPICVILPCHRVVPGGDGIGGYAGGPAAKERLLRLEAGRAAG